MKMHGKNKLMGYRKSIFRAIPERAIPHQIERHGKMTQNIACRIFKEQIKLINQLPDNERPIVLYLAVNDCFNQFDFQNETQIETQNENQNECAYVSVSVSESLYLNQLSEISKCVLELLKKNIVCKEFSNNYGGKRNGSGRKSMKLVKSGQNGQNEQTETKTGTKIIRPTLQEVEQYCKERNNHIDPNEWFNYYSANGWKVGRNPMKDWKACVRYWEQKHNSTQPLLSGIKKTQAQLIEEHNLKHIEELFGGNE